ncbi:MAG: 16S rRNA (cytosine(967)-C(5))-methyltransferase RsmB [Verrucomicrobiales bacterium]|nr:16S rRNA (cytosine(967)-C(5))-methyltransferase RsmB [Verrucomicrobiales bacterium]
MSARRCALEALTQWEETSRYASDILTDLGGRFRLTPQDRALAQEILFGTIRNLYLLDTIIDRFRKGSLQSGTQDLLRIGLYQLFLTEIAEHAAVNETVNLSKKHEKGLVNAILRNAQRQKDEIIADIKTWPLEDQFSQPEFLIERWTEQYGAEAALSLCQWNNEAPKVYGRINALAPDKEALNRVRSETEPSLLGDDYPDFFVIEGPPNTDWLDEGLIYIQDPSTSQACSLLAPQPGEAILDACAAPGGKTALLAAMRGNEGRIVATDNVELRLEQMQENFKRLHLSNVEVALADWAFDAEEPFGGEKFDAILLDAPCSNTGVMRRRIDVRWRVQPRDFATSAKLQSTLIRNTARALKPGGRLIYSTCSIDRVENEEVIEASGMTIEKVVTSLPWRDGHDGAFAATLRA